MKLSELNELMADYNGQVAYGSECMAWADFVADCYERLGLAPWNARAINTDVPQDMAEYWIDVTTNSDYRQ